MAALRDRLQRGILAQVEEAAVNGEGAPRVPNTTNIHFDHIDGEAMVIALDLKGLGGFDRRCLLVGRDRTVACAAGDGTAAGSSALQHPLQPGQAVDG
jgi:hypothetical protein